jgi:hypothetical protein
VICAAIVMLAPLALFRAEYWPESLVKRLIMGIAWGLVTPFVIPLGIIAIQSFFVRMGVAGP